MFRTQLRRLFAQRVYARNSSTAAAGEKTDASKFSKTSNFLYANRQAIINTVGVAFVFYYSLHNRKVQLAWDEREAEVAVIQKELDDLKAVISDDQWMTEATLRIQRGSSLKEEIGLRIGSKGSNSANNDTISDSQSVKTGML